MDLFINRFDSLRANLLVFKVFLLFLLFLLFWYCMYNIIRLVPYLYYYHEILLSLHKNKG